MCVGGEFFLQCRGRDPLRRAGADVKCADLAAPLKVSIREGVSPRLIQRLRRTEPLPDDTHHPTYPNWAQRVREVPDMLVAAQLSLGPLAKGESTATSAEARRIVGDACDLLRVALTNLVEVTRSSPGFPLGSTGLIDGVDNQRDPRMSAPSCADKIVAARPAEECALTRRGARPASSFPEATTRLTDDQLDRLRRCANGNTLRFESTAIVAALVGAGYASEGAGCVVTVTPKGHRYLQTHPE